MSLFTVSEIIL